MERIGVRELRQHASRYLRRVAAGESFLVTDRGHAVAVLSPPEHELSLYDELIAAGDLVPGDGGELPDPMPIARDAAEAGGRGCEQERL